MPFVLVLNSSNVTGNYLNNYTYRFTNGSIEIPPNSEMCVSSITLPYSWYNINQPVYSNGTFQYTLPGPGATVSTTYTVNFLPGFYQVSDINNYIQAYMFALGQYVLLTGGTIVYFINLLTDQTYYTNQFILNVVPTSASVITLYGAGATVPGNTGSNPYSYPTIQSLPLIIIPANTSANGLTSFGQLIGYSPNTYPVGSVIPYVPSGVLSTTNRSVNVLGNITPNLTPVNSLIISCNLVDNNITIPSNILDSFNINAIFGANIQYTANFEKMVSLVTGKYQFMTLTLLDQNGNPIQANDGNVLITLIIKMGKKELLTYRLSDIGNR